MKGLSLTELTGENLKVQIIDACGWMAGLAVSEVFEDAATHGKNPICQVLDETDHMVLVLDCECPDHLETATTEPRAESVIGELCQQGVVLYYYHSIYDKHHHVCLAVKKRPLPNNTAKAG